MLGLLFTYILTYGGAAVSLFNPFIGLLIYVCFAIVRPESMWYWSVPEGNYSRIVAAGLLLGWGLRGFGSWNFGQARGVVLAFFGFWVWSLISSLQAANPAIGLVYVETLAKILLPFLVGITMIDSVRKLKLLAWVILVCQGFVAWEMNLAYYSGFNRVWEIGFGGMDNNCVAISMVAGVGLAFFLGINAPRLWQKGLALASALLMAHTVMFAYSRGGMMALIVTAVICFLLLPKQPKHYLIFAIVLVVCLRLAGQGVRDRFNTSFADTESRDDSAQSRIDLWSHCWDVMLKHPVFGVGPSHWPLIAPRYGWSLGKEAHTLWLQVGAELGFTGLILLLTFYLLCAVRLWPLTRPQVAVSDPFLRDLARMVIASLIGFMVAAQFVTIVGLEVPYYITLLGAGALKLTSTSAAVLANVPARRFVLGQMAPRVAVRV
ncbi:MAG: O-antigen ligase family protein [Planctomycetes bacterium]|nr:O-antigen ligase family protein [Planctomycetota bacterium]